MKYSSYSRQSKVAIPTKTRIEHSFQNNQINYIIQFRIGILERFFFYFELVQSELQRAFQYFVFFLHSHILAEYSFRRDDYCMFLFNLSIDLTVAN